VQLTRTVGAPLIGGTRALFTVDVAGRPLLVVHDRQDREIGFILILMRMIKIMILIINKIMKNCINL
jgi:hypothetical protein